MRSVMTLSFLAVLGLGPVISGCDRQSAPAPQPVTNLAAPNNVAPNAAAAAEEPKGVVDRSMKGKAWPQVSFQAPNGNTVSIADFKGRPVLVNLWATWCAPCVKELPSIEALANREAGRLQVLVISQDMDGRKSVDPWWQKQQFTLLQPYLDARGDFGAALGGGGALPTTLLYDAKGNEIWRVVGPMDWSGTVAAKLIAEAFRP